MISWMWRATFYSFPTIATKQITSDRGSLYYHGSRVASADKPKSLTRQIYWRVYPPASTFFQLLHNQYSQRTRRLEEGPAIGPLPGGLIDLIKQSSELARQLIKYISDPSSTCSIPEVWFVICIDEKYGLNRRPASCRARRENGFSARLIKRNAFGRDLAST